MYIERKHLTLFALMLLISPQTFGRGIRIDDAQYYSAPFLSATDILSAFIPSSSLTVTTTALPIAAIPTVTPTKKTTPETPTPTFTPASTVKPLEPAQTPTPTVEPLEPVQTPAATSGETPPQPLFAGIDFTALNKTIIKDDKLSDHTLEVENVNGTPICTWNMWGYNTPSGFGPDHTEDQIKFDQRFRRQLDIITQLLRSEPNAIICLQEFTNHTDSAHHKLLGRTLQALNPNLTFAFNKFQTVGSGKFGVVTIYNKRTYSILQDGSSPGASYSRQASRAFTSSITAQNNRVLKIIVRNKTTTRTFSVVNVHLAWGSRNGNINKAMLDELMDYATKHNSTRIPAVVTGDFNYNLNYYHPSTPSIVVKPTGASYSWDRAGNQQRQNITDGFVTVTP